jgi:hypothetical protein
VLNRPPKRPDRVCPLVKNQEYAYDWEQVITSRTTLILV